MSESNGHVPSARAVTRLTVAVWAVALAILLNAGATLFGPIPSKPSINDDESTESQVPPEVLSSLQKSFFDEFAEFHAWPIEKQIETASVIAITRYEMDGDVTKSVIAEILKQEPGAKFYYKVGDIYERDYGSRKEHASYGDGMIMFFVGSPPMGRYGVSHRDGRITGMGDMPFEIFRDMIKQAEAE